MRIDWSIAKRALAHHNADLMVALFAQTVLMRREGPVELTPAEALDALRAHGIAKSTAYRYLKLLRTPLFAGQSLIAEHEGKLYPVGFNRVLFALSISHLGDITLTDDDLQNMKTFRAALYSGVMFGRNRDQQDGVTISLQGLSKLTGKSRTTVWRRTRMTPARRNFCIAETNKGLAPVRFRKGRMAQIRNTYYDPRPAVQYDSQKPGELGICASEVKVLSPEDGEWYTRQRYTLDMYKQKNGLPVHLSAYNRETPADVFLEERVSVQTGEVFGYFRRVQHGSELESVLAMHHLGSLGMADMSFVYQPWNSPLKEAHQRTAKNIENGISPYSRNFAL